jgi:hypothetical protein
LFAILQCPSAVDVGMEIDRLSLHYKESSLLCVHTHLVHFVCQSIHVFLVLLTMLCRHPCLALPRALCAPVGRHLCGCLAAVSCSPFCTCRRIEVCPGNP